MSRKSDMKTEVIQVKVDEQMKEKLQKLADADLRSLSDYCRVVLIKHVQEIEANKRKKH